MPISMRALVDPHFWREPEDTAKTHLASNCKNNVHVSQYLVTDIVATVLSKNNLQYEAKMVVENE